MAVFYVFFGLQLCFALWLFIRNRRALKKIELYREIANRYPWLSYLVPVPITVVITVVVGYFTDCEFSTILGSVILLPLFTTHWTMDPRCVRSVCGQQEMRNPLFRTIVTKGVRSRFLTFCIVVNYVLMQYSVICCS